MVRGKMFLPYILLLSYRLNFVISVSHKKIIDAYPHRVKPGFCLMTLCVIDIRFINMFCSIHTRRGTVLTQFNHTVN